jgi:23S rRNA G2069 N7-methylase RlmK/C1962 C5-methylase RlmI
LNKKEKLEKDLEENKKEISSLQIFRQTKPVKQLLRQLFGEQSQIRSQLRKLLQTQEEKEKTRQERVEKANKNRSQKMKRTYRYFRAILQNYPIDMSLREIRSAFSKHKQGLETDISDVIWRNPSS